MKYTANYNWKKPEGSDYVGPDAYNDNFDDADAKLAALASALGDNAALDTHIADGDIHVTATEKAGWDGKADGLQTLAAPTDDSAAPAAVATPTALNALLQAAWNKLKYLYTTIATKANLTSPALTGTPTAPTAAAGTNTTQLATTAFVTAADNLKANLASPTFTGTPAAPTAAAGTNTTQLATTAFVTAAANLKLNLAGGTLTGQVVAQDSADATKRVRNIQLSTTDLTAGTSALANGIIYFVYE